MTEDLSVLTRWAIPPDITLSYGSDTPDSSTPDSGSESPSNEQCVDLRFGGHGCEQKPLVVIIHGGFWRPRYDRAHVSPMADSLATLGWTVAVIEYRRIPGEPLATLQDIRSALEYVTAITDRHNGRYIVIGHSAGGHLALWAATACVNSKLLGTLALAPAADLWLAHQQWLGDGAVMAFLGKTPENRSDIADLDPCQLKPPKTPVTIVHGCTDDTVPLSVSESYLQMHPNHSQVRLVRLQDTGHFALIDPLSEAWPKIIDELECLCGQ